MRKTKNNRKTKQMKKQIVTPTGEALYPHLHEPDYKFDESGVYQTRLILSEADYNSVKGQYDEIYQAVYNTECEKAGKELKHNDSDPFRECEEGLYILAKQPAEKNTRAHGLIKFSIKAFNAQGKLIQMPRVGTGSKLRLALEPKPWTVNGKFGVTLRLRSVQIIDLVEYGNESVFDEVEGGFSGGEEFTNELTNEETPSQKDGDFSF